MNKGLMPISFHDDTLFLVEKDEKPYVPVKPIVENMGLSWGSQRIKLKSNVKRWGVSMIDTPSPGGNQEMVCMPLRKLPAFLLSIDSRKVKAELREKIETYQEECDEALWNYWTEGQAVNPRISKGEPGWLPRPGLSMEAISALCREADKHFKGRVSLRALNYYTGMPVDDLLAEMETLAPKRIAYDPVQKFIGERLVLDPEGSETKRAVYQAYKDYCEEKGLKVYDHVHFGRRLLKFAPEIRAGRLASGARETAYFGVRMRNV